MDSKEKSTPDPLPGQAIPLVHIHILMDSDKKLFVTIISLEETEDWSEYLKDEHEDD